VEGGLGGLWEDDEGRGRAGAVGPEDFGRGEGG
jgi:hypothetical protein